MNTVMKLASRGEKALTSLCSRLLKETIPSEPQQWTGNILEVERVWSLARHLSRQDLLQCLTSRCLQHQGSVWAAEGSEGSRSRSRGCHQHDPSAHGSLQSPLKSTQWTQLWRDMQVLSLVVRGRRNRNRCSSIESWRGAAHAKVWNVRALWTTCTLKIWASLSTILSLDERLRGSRNLSSWSPSQSCSANSAGIGVEALGYQWEMTLTKRS